MENEKERNRGMRHKRKQRRSEDSKRGRRIFYADEGFKGVSLDSPMASRIQPEASFPASHPYPTKVYSISTTNENKGVNVTRSDEVPGNISTDRTSSTAGKSGKLSPDKLDEIRNDIAKGKLINKRFTKACINNSDASASLGSKDGMQLPSASTEMLHASVPSTSSGLAIEIVCSQKPPILRVDTTGREIDEHGNVVNATKPNNLSTLKVNINKQKKDAFHMLKPEEDMNPESDPFFDLKMGINMTKIERPKRMNFEFVEEGKWGKEAEYMKTKIKFGELPAKELKTKPALSAKATEAPDANPNLIEVAVRVSTKDKPKDPILEVEWCKLTAQKFQDQQALKLEDSNTHTLIMGFTPGFHTLTRLHANPFSRKSKNSDDFFIHKIAP